MVLFSFVFLFCASSFWVWFKWFRPEAEAPYLTKDQLASVIRDEAAFYRFPTEVEAQYRGNKPEPVILQYSFDAELQEGMEQLIEQYRPDYGAFVALDAKTGRILSMVSYSQKDTKSQENLTLRASFPAASVFKVVTAAAAIEERKYSASTVIPYTGANHTLYKSNILKNSVNRWTRYITLKDAFAKSVNSVFGKIGAFSVGAQELSEYAGRFGFNRTIASDLPIQMGLAKISEGSNDYWQLAESASGFTAENTMSPLQGALIAAAIVNDGIMMEPYVVQSAYSQDGTKLYEATPKIGSQPIDMKTSLEIRTLMRQTIARGTSQKTFRGFFKGAFAGLDVGGKTGSLTGHHPFGRYDWFVGYASDGGRKIALASLTIHEKYWRVKSSWLGRRAMERYFSRYWANRNRQVASR